MVKNKYVCTAERCKWRIDCGGKIAMCSRRHCLNIRNSENGLPPVKWRGIINHFKY